MNDLLEVEDLALLDALVAETIVPVPPPVALRQQILDTVRGVPQDSRTVRAADGKWTAVAPGVTAKVLTFDRERHTATLLMSFERGAIMPAHDHQGAEQSYVVSGSCRVGSIYLRAGDFHQAPAGSHHGDVVSDEGCVLLLVVDEADCRAA